MRCRFPAGAIRTTRRAEGAGPNTRRQTAMGKSIDERSHEAIRAYLRHRGIEVLGEDWAHGSDSIDFIAMDDEELVFVDAATKCGGYDMPREEPDQVRFERIAAAYLAEAEVEGLTGIRYDVAVTPTFPTLGPTDEKLDQIRSGQEPAMSFTPEQKKRALEVLEECDRKVALAIRKLGYLCRQTMYAWIRENDAAHVRTAGRPFSHYDPETRAEAVRLVRGGMDGKDVARALGVPNAATVYNWARAAGREGPSMPAKATAPGGSEPTWSVFEGTPEERIRQLELENDILRRVVEVLKAASLDALTNREKTLVIEHLRQTTGHALKDLTASLRISKSSYEYQWAALARPDKHAGLRSKIADIFEGASRSRGYRYVTHELRELEEPIVVSEKVVRRIMREGAWRSRARGPESPTAPTRARSRMPPKTLRSATSPQASRTSCGSPTSPSSPSPQARPISVPCSTASTAPCLHGRYRARPTRGFPILCSRRHAQAWLRMSIPSSTATAAAITDGLGG